VRAWTALPLCEGVIARCCVLRSRWSCLPSVGSTCWWVTCTAARWHTSATGTHRDHTCWGQDTMVSCHLTAAAGRGLIVVPSA
jgi:hypothetical protein